MNKKTLTISKKILIVEDDKKLSGALSKKMTKEGFDVVLAYNGVEGLQKAKTKKPDLILLDIIMPVMDGLTMLNELRQSGNDTPVIVLTNLSGDDKLSEALSNHSYDYLVKASYSLEDVVKKIKKILNK